MSDVMLLGVLRMPVNENDPLCMAHFISRAREAADRIEADAHEITRLQAENEALRARVDELEMIGSSLLHGHKQSTVDWEAFNALERYFDLLDQAAALERQSEGGE